MADPAFEILPGNLEEDADPAPDSDSQILVLDPTDTEPGTKSILLDQPKQLIGWDVECSIQLPDSGVHARHAVILRGQRQVVVKAWDPRTWLNGTAVTESPLSPGDLLKVGPIEFRVRAATSDELLRDLPTTAPDLDHDPHPVPTQWLQLRRSRLAAIRFRLKDRRAALEREFEQLRAEKAQLESERRQFRCELEKAAGEAAIAQPQTADGEPDEPVDSVADYMQRLLGRMRAERPNDYPTDESRSSGAQTGNSDGDPESPQELGTTPRRRVHNVNDVRAGVGPLREIANLSARAAVATHSSRKLRRSVRITLPLAVISFVLAGVLMLLGGGKATIFGQAFGTMMLGVIVAIEMAHSLWKIRGFERVRTRPVNEHRTKALPAGPTDDPGNTAGVSNQSLPSSTGTESTAGSADSSSAD
jgi:hypothetical protein